MAGLLCRGRRLEKFDILTLRTSRANRTAVHARGFHRDEEPAVETGISGQHRLIERIVIGHWLPSTLGRDFSHILFGGLYSTGSSRWMTSRIRTCTCLLPA